MSKQGRLPSRRQVLRRASALGVGGLAAPYIFGTRAAHAAWPADHPVRLIVANSPGGPSDLMARFIAPELGTALGGTFIVDNKAGGGGNIGIIYASRAEPDGTTLHLATSVWQINPGLYDPSPYDPYTAMVPVAGLAASPTVFVVRPDLGVNSLKEMIALAKKDQSKFNIGVPNTGTTLHLGAELLKYREGLNDVATILYSGGGQAVQGILAGNTQALCSSLAPVVPHIKSGTLKGLAILGNTPWPELPDLPTTEALGEKDYNFETYCALMAPPKTPPDIIKRLEQASIAALSKPEFKARIFQSGFLAAPTTAEQHAQRIAHDVPLFRDIIKNANIKIK